MKKNSFYLSLVGALALSLVSALFLNIDMQNQGVLAGMAGLSALFLVKYARRKSRMEGRDDRMKVALETTTVLYELVILLGVFSTAIIPKYAAAIVFAAIAFTEILNLELNQQLKVSKEADIGREGRTLVILVSLLAFNFNEYYLFYGTLFVFVLTVYDALRILHMMIAELR
ncbi:MAG: hypothetical protein ABEI58_02235 [Candidatus Nanohaloarchaea archaeon]